MKLTSQLCNSAQIKRLKYISVVKAQVQENANNILLKMNLLHVQYRVYHRVKALMVLWDTQAICSKKIKVGFK